jgi:serine/threonine protein kinase
MTKQDPTASLERRTADCETALDLPLGDGSAVINRGATLGRYIVIDLVGSGGMGVVYSAYDPDLDRRVALKVLKPGISGSEAARTRLVREAQAMAKLPHPNVIAVHDVGVFGKQVFIAMELVQGTTLGRWMRQLAGGWREVLACYLQAGRGLAAAHAAGLVHRDFKPDNVLIGSDGRVRVLDFGLVGASGYDAAPDSVAPMGALEPALTTPLTHEGALLGTPAYMSPEQLLGQPVDAKADQFSFCVALFEGLYGVRPFGGESPVQRVAQITKGAVAKPPAGSLVPDRLYRLLQRGLSARAEERFPSMEALLAALAEVAAPPRRRTRMAVLALGAATVLTVAAVEVVRWRHNACPDPSARLAGVWDGPRRDAVARAFAATGLPYARDTLEKVDQILDRYTQRWSSVQGETCRATRLEGRQSEQLFDLRMACLDRRRAALGALTAAWTGGPLASGALEHAVDAASSLPPLDECSDVRVLTEAVPLPGDPALRARIDSARHHLDRVKALLQTSQLKEARPEAEAARRETEAIGYLPLRAESAALVGEMKRRFGDPDSVETLAEATRLAALAHDDRLAAEATVNAVRALADAQIRGNDAILFSRAADAIVARAGNRPEQRGRLLEGEARAFETQSRWAEARAALDEARRTYASQGPKSEDVLRVMLGQARLANSAGDPRLARQLGEEGLAAHIASLGGDHPQTAAVLHNLAMAEESMGDSDAARAHYQRSLDIKTKVYGGDTPMAASSLNNLGQIDINLGRFDAAAPVLERARAIRERLLGPEHPYVATVISNLSDVARARGDYAHALELAERALAISSKAYGPTHPDNSTYLHARSRIYEAKGDLDAAQADLVRALALQRAAMGASHPDVLQTEVRLAQHLALRKQCGASLKASRPALAKLETALGSTHPAVIWAGAVVGRCALATGAVDEALPLLEAAAAAGERGVLSYAKRGRIRFDLAQALRAHGGDAARVRQLALGAREDLARGGADVGRDRAQLEAWLQK